MPDSSSRPSILTEHGLHADWVVLPLIAAGFEVDTCPFEELASRLDSGRYNAVVIGRFYAFRQTKQGELAMFERLTAALKAFIGRGGGVYLALPCAEQLNYHLVFEAFGARLLKINVQQNADCYEDRDRRYAYTTDVSPEFAESVTGVWLPIKAGLATTTFPVQADEADGWRIILRAGLDSHTERIPMVGYGLPGEEMEGFSASVPVMAAKDFDSGRLVASGITGGFNIYSPHNYPPGKQMLADGFCGKSSDFLTLFLNLMHWLAEPSFKAGTLGGAVTSPEAITPQVPRFPADPPVQWAVRTFPPDPQPLQGLIGARTAYSNGSGTVVEYVAKAKAAGHDFIVFLEDFAALDTEKYTALQADCEAHTTDTFLAVPGYTLRDVVGSHHFQYGYTIELPREDLLSADGTYLENKSSNNPRNSRVEHVHFSLIFGEMHLRGRRGAYRHAESAKSILQNRANDSIALVTWEDGQVIEDIRDDYRFLTDKGLRLSPVALTFMNSPEDFDRVVAAGWRNMIIEPYAGMPDVLRKYMAPELEWWGTIDEEIAAGPRYRFDCWQYGNPFQSISSGPVVHAWTMSVSGRDPGWGAPDHEIPPTGDWYRVDVAQYRLRLRVTSEVGLAEVIVSDGVRPIRRWQLCGEQEFATELDLTHHQQTHLLLEARDVNGGVAMTADYACMRLDWCEYYCADRNNPLNIGYEKDKDGLAYGWAGTDYLTYNNHLWGGSSPVIGKWWFTEDPIYPVPMDPLRDITAPTDGGVGAGGAGLCINIKPPALDPPELGLMVDSGPQMISTDVAICDFLCDFGYDPAAPYFQGGEEGFGLYGMYPSRYFRVHRRAWTYRPRPHALTTAVYQYDLSLKRPLRLNEPLLLGGFDPAEQYLHRSDGIRVTLTNGPIELAWLPGDAIVSWSNGARPAIFINDGVPLLLKCATGSSDLKVFLPVEEMPGPGAVTTIRIIGAGGTYDHRDPNLVDQLRAVMGFAGDPAYTVSMDAGEITGRRLFLEMDGTAAGAAFTIPQTDLPMAIPTQVHHLNDNWPAVLYDRTTRRWRPLGMLEGTAYATLDTTREVSCFIGHPVTASHPGIVLSLAQIADDRWALEVHNPLGVAVETTIQPSPHFPLLAWEDEHLTMKPGSSCRFELSIPVEVVR
ncbi:MAG: hypothetical protein ACYDBB_18360 [Armatimonadota bacterium]